MSVAILSLSNGAMNDRRRVTPDLMEVTNRYARVPGSERSFVRTLQTGVGVLGSKHMACVAANAARLDRPTLLPGGKQDPVFPVRNAPRAAALLPQAHLRLIDRSGHYPHREQSDIFATAVCQFLA